MFAQRVFAEMFDFRTFDYIVKTVLSNWSDVRTKHQLDSCNKSLA